MALTRKDTAYWITGILAVDPGIYYRLSTKTLVLDTGANIVM